MRRLLVLLPSLVLLALPATADASAQRVLADWRADSSIDGDYSLADLRAANRQVSAEEREYFNWDEAYADAVRRKSLPPDQRDDVPDEPPVAIPVDANRNGKIDPVEKKVAARKTKQLRAEWLKQRREELKEKNSRDDEDDDEAAVVAASDDDTGSGDDSTPWPLIGVVALLGLAAGVATWRTIALRRRDGSPEAEAGGIDAA